LVPRFQDVRAGGSLPRQLEMSQAREQRPQQQKMGLATAQGAAIEWDSLLMPSVYDPPQLKKSFQPGPLRNINWATRDSPLCNSFPCCLSQCIMACCLKPCCHKKQVELSDPDEWFHRMLQAESPSCPERLRGIWWMKDNIVPEELGTFGDAEWVSVPEQEEMLATKLLRQNWAYGTNAFASTLSCFNAAAKTEQKLVQHGKWLFMGSGATGSMFLTMIEEGDDIVNPDGSKPRYTPGLDAMRVTWEDEARTAMTYQYFARKVAYLDGEGNLVKTDGYDELMERTRLSGVKGSCCNFGLCNIPEREYPQIWAPESNVVFLEFAPSLTE